MPTTSDDATLRRGNDRRGRGLVAIAVLSIGLVGVGVALGPALGQDREDQAASGVEASTVEPLATESVSRGDLIEVQDEGGAVSYGESWDIPIAATGVVTRAPDEGALIEPGQPLIEVAGKPVHLAEGATPLYRTLDYRSASKDRLEGDDVAQLQRFLLEAGHDDKGRLVDDGVFGRSTERAVEAWQEEQGLEQTGWVDRAQLVFHPGSVRVAAAPRVGADFDRLEVTEAAQEVTAQFDRDDRAFVPVGADVTIELDADDSVPGVVTEVSSMTADDGSRRLDVRIEPATALPPEVERVNVVASRVGAEDALIVPVRAVVALASGGYGLEIETSSGPQLRRIELGAVVDDRVEVSGDVAAGDAVLVPRTIGADR